jgi:hypothetical protein
MCFCVRLTLLIIEEKNKNGEKFQIEFFLSFHFYDTMKATMKAMTMNDEKDNNSIKTSSCNSIDNLQQKKLINNCYSRDTVKASLDSSSLFSNFLNKNKSEFYCSDLEWDRHDDFHNYSETDSVSDYDFNERMADLVKKRILEFDMISNTSSVSSFIYNHGIIYNYISNSSLNNDDDSALKVKMRPRKLCKNRRSKTSLSIKPLSSTPSPSTDTNSPNTKRYSTPIIPESSSTPFTPPFDGITLEDLFHMKNLNYDDDDEKFQVLIHLNNKKKVIFNPSF